jgi:hypothetical protein
MILCGIGSYETPSCLLWPLANMIALQITISHTLRLLLMGAHEGHGLQVETAIKRGTLAVNYGIGWLHNGKWWSLIRKAKSSLWDVRNCAHTMVEVILNSYQCNVPYLLSEVKVLQRNHLYQNRHRTGLSRPVQLRMPQSPFLQLLCIAVTVIHIFSTVVHPWLQFLEQPSHPGKRAGSRQDSQRTELIKNSNTFTHSKQKRSTRPVAYANEKLLGQVSKCFLCNRCHPCDVKKLYYNQEIRTNTQYSAGVSNVQLTACMRPASLLCSVFKLILFCV